MKKIVNVAGNIIAAVFAAIGVLCISVTITVMFRPLYYFDIDYLDIPQMSGTVSYTHLDVYKRQAVCSHFTEWGMILKHLKS